MGHKDCGATAVFTVCMCVCVCGGGVRWFGDVDYSVVYVWCMQVPTGAGACVGVLSGGSPTGVCVTVSAYVCGACIFVHIRV